MGWKGRALERRVGWREGRKLESVERVFWLSSGGGRGLCEVGAHCVADGTNSASFSILTASVLVVGTKWKSGALLAWLLLLVFKRAVRAA